MVITNSLLSHNPNFVNVRELKSNFRFGFVSIIFRIAKLLHQIATQDTILRHPLGLYGLTSLNVL